jgi:hypothetical protein
VNSWWGSRRRCGRRPGPTGFLSAIIALAGLVPRWGCSTGKASTCRRFPSACTLATSPLPWILAGTPGTTRSAGRRCRSWATGRAQGRRPDLRKLHLGLQPEPAGRARTSLAECGVGRFGTRSASATSDAGPGSSHRFRQLARLSRPLRCATSFRLAHDGRAAWRSPHGSARGCGVDGKSGTFAQVYGPGSTRAPTTAIRRFWRMILGLIIAGLRDSAAHVHGKTPVCGNGWQDTPGTGTRRATSLLAGDAVGVENNENSVGGVPVMSQPRPGSWPCVSRST